MNPERTDGAQVTQVLEELRSALKQLGERVAALEAAAATEPSAASRDTAAAQLPAAEMAAQPAAIDLELVLVISAAIAAFLGKKPHIRQIQLLGHAAWAQQGRVTIQASHRLAVPHH
jgi:methylmalonyl-CoA carboxyltransferase 12S subunit